MYVCMYVCICMYMYVCTHIRTYSNLKLHVAGGKMHMSLHFVSKLYIYACYATYAWSTRSPVIWYPLVANSSKITKHYGDLLYIPGYQITVTPGLAERSRRYAEACAKS